MLVFQAARLLEMVAIVLVSFILGGIRGRIFADTTFLFDKHPL